MLERLNRLKNIFEIGIPTRIARQWIYRPDLSVVGLYGSGNVGDTALKESVVSVVEKENIQYGVQIIEFRPLGIEWHPNLKYTIVGGGGIGNNKNIEYLSDIYNGRGENIVFQGVDFGPTCKFSHKSRIFLESEKKIVCRSRHQKEKNGQLSR